MTHKSRVLVVEDQRNERNALTRLLKLEGYDVVAAADASTAMEFLDGNIDLILSDLRLGEMDGLDLLRRWKESKPLTPFVIMTAFGDVETAVLAMKLGAVDYLTKPVKPEELLILVRRSLESPHREIAIEGNIDPLQNGMGFERIIHRSAEMDLVLDRARRAAQSESLVLLLGETGTGKELIAKAIHQVSNRRDQPFVIVDMAAIPPELVESELFGHRRGAFTGAVNDRVGRFAAAHGGTLFIDEIGDFALASQAKLLRALETLAIMPVGSDEEIKIDVRVIAATSRDLRAMTEAGRFREDLYYRLDVVTIQIPPLRRRPKDVPVLAARFVEDSCRRNRRPSCDVDPELLRTLGAYDWPGNVRQLRNTIESMVVMSSTDILTIDDLPEFVRRRESPGDRTILGEVPLEALERNAVLAALNRCDGNRTNAARVLGISVRTLQRRLKAWGLNSGNEPSMLEPNIS